MDRKNEECRIGCHFPRRGRRKVHIHGSGDETVEKCHQHTADHSKRDSFHRNLFPARLLDLIGIGIHQNGNRNQENTAEKNQKILTMDSMQSTTSEDVANGTTYLSAMEQNLSVLKEALG